MEALEPDSTDLRVRQSSHWPPGSLMAFVSSQHRGLGVVIANLNDQVAVLWDEACKGRFRVYHIHELNPRVIVKVQPGSL